MAAGNIQGPQNGGSNPTQNSENAAERRIAVWTIVVGIFTALLFVTSCFSDYFIWAELKHNEGLAARSKEERRAYLSPAIISQVPNGVDKDGKPMVAFLAQWQNLGGTRTEWADGWVSVQYFPDEVPFNLDVTKPTVELKNTLRMVVGPTGVLQTAAIGLTNEQATRSITKGTVLAWGYSEYADIYDPTVVRKGTFCYKLVPNGSMITATPDGQKNTVPTYQQIPYRNDCNRTE